MTRLICTVESLTNVIIEESFMYFDPHFGRNFVYTKLGAMHVYDLINEKESSFQR